MKIYGQMIASPDGEETWFFTKKRRHYDNLELDFYQIKDIGFMDCDHKDVSADHRSIGMICKECGIRMKVKEVIYEPDVRAGK